MTKMHFTRAAEIVKAINDGYFITDVETSTEADGNLSPTYVRAKWTAEAFIILFREYNSRFNEAKFLKACGLA